MYSQTTIKNAVSELQEKILAYREKIAIGEKVKICISTRNRKIGNTLNVSLAPIITCSNCSGCMNYCYDIKAVLLYGNVKNARSRNTALYTEDPEEYFNQIENRIAKRKKNKYFRWHVSGDIPDMNYLKNMVRIAKNNPDWIFWTYTKNYAIVNLYCKEYGKDSIPANLSIMFSEWQGMPMINPYGFPEFRVIMKNQEKPQNVKWCCGNCNECIKKRSHCVKGETVYCMEH